jgi:hypothetical protein
MNLLDTRPEVLADQSNPQELIAHLRTLDKLNKMQLKSLDRVLAEWVVAALARSSDSDSVIEMHTLCNLAESFVSDSKSEEANRLGIRWIGFADLLDAKRLSMRAKSSLQSQELLQEPAILEQLRNKGEMTQSELGQALQLSPGRISQVLAIMESRAQVSRNRRGKENWVSLMPRPAANAPTHVLMQERAPYTTPPAPPEALPVLQALATDTAQMQADRAEMDAILARSEARGAAKAIAHALHCLIESGMPEQQARSTLHMPQDKP